MNTIASLPDKVTATLADQGPDGWVVYRLADKRGYTHRLDTIRIGTYDLSGKYHVERLGRDGWQPLLTGQIEQDAPISWARAVRRAVSVLYGMEDHG